MFDRVFGFIVAFACNGVLALVFAVALFFVAALVLPFAAIPVEVIFGDKVAEGLLSAMMNSWTFRIVYLAIFINLMMDTYEIPNLKSLMWRRRLVTVTITDKKPS